MISNQTRVLFVCSVMGVRACIASHFCRLFSEGTMEPVPASFQKGVFGSKIINFAKSKGIQLPAESPRDVFSIHRRGECFDYVITLCDDAAREQCPIFRRSIGTLFTQTVLLSWHIPDFRSIEGDEAFVMGCWEQIVSDIEAHVQHFVYQTASAQTLNNGDHSPKG